MAPYHAKAVLVTAPASIELSFVLGDAGINNPRHIIFFVFDFGQKTVIAFFFLVVLDFDVLDGDFFVPFDNAHAGLGFGFFFLGRFVFFVLAGGGNHQGRFFYNGFFFILFGLILAVFIVFVLVILGLFGADRGGGDGGFGLAAAALLVERFRLKAGAAFRAFDRAFRKVVKTRGAAGAPAFIPRSALTKVRVPVR